MTGETGKTLKDLVKHVGRYPEDAFLFVREGLAVAAEKIHGPETEAHEALHQYLLAQGLDWSDLIVQYHSGQLPDSVVEAIEAAGGCEKLNRHVSGRELCWALRDHALERWGIMARVALESWGIHRTADFGRIVFAFIEFDMMRKQVDDSVEDFNEVYNFREAFDEPFRGGLTVGDSQPADE